MTPVAARTIAVYSDLACPWAHVAVFRLHRMRAKLDLTDEVSFDLRSFPLEIFNEQPTPKKILDAEISVAGGLEPDAGWQVWQRPQAEYPVTMLPPLEAVQAAKAQSLRAAEELDRALRVALFRDSRVISMRHDILDIASGCDAVDVDALIEAIDSGDHRSDVIEQKAESESDRIKGSPHLFLPDGSDFHNPGIELAWEGEPGKGFPTIEADSPAVYEEIFERVTS